MLPAQESIHTTKEKLHSALKSRGITEINGDPVPEDPVDIEFGVPINRNELEKGWVRLDLQVEENSDSEAVTTKKASAGRPKKNTLSESLQGLSIRDGQAVAFRFRKASSKNENDEMDENVEDSAWDVVIPSLDDEDPE